MGRVARYKKVKSFDRLHSGGEYIWGSNNGRDDKKKRSKTAEKMKERKLKKRKHNNRNADDWNDVDGFDLPPQGKDDFNLIDFQVKKVKKKQLDDELYSAPTLKTLSKVSTAPASTITDNKIKIGNKTLTCTIPKDDLEERKLIHSLNIDAKSGKGKSEFTNTIQGRKEGESTRAFNKRLKEETKFALAQDFKKKSSSTTNANTDIDAYGEQIGKKEKRKEYMKTKKMRKKKGISNFEGNLPDNDEIDTNLAQDDSDFVTGERAITATTALPSFLHQVEEPPSFNLLPRGAKKKSKTKANREGGMNEQKIKAEQDAMEAMRRKVQAQYSMIKSQRRKEGSFHL